MALLTRNRAYCLARTFMVMVAICLMGKGMYLFELSFDNKKLMKKLFQPQYFQEWEQFENVNIFYNKENGITMLTFDDTNTDIFMRIKKGILPLNEEEMIPYKTPAAYITFYSERGELVKGDLFSSNQIQLLEEPYWIYDVSQMLKSTPDGEYCILNEEEYEIVELFNVERERYFNIMSAVKRNVMEKEIILYVGECLCYCLFLFVIKLKQKGKLSFPLLL